MSSLSDENVHRRIGRLPEWGSHAETLPSLRRACADLLPQSDTAVARLSGWPDPRAFVGSNPLPLSLLVQKERAMHTLCDTEHVNPLDRINALTAMTPRLDLDGMTEQLRRNPAEDAARWNAI